MSNKTIDSLAVCPFYVRESSKTIACEGLIDVPGSLSVLHFLHESEKLLHERDFCTCKNCQGCPVFLALQEKYSERRKPYAFKC